VRGVVRPAVLVPGKFDARERQRQTSALVLALNLLLDLAQVDHGAVRLLTRTGLDSTHKYPSIAKAVPALDARQAYLDGELCGVGPDGLTSFSIVQLALDSGNAAALVFF
jgi:hypothetical protein